MAVFPWHLMKCWTRAEGLDLMKLTFFWGFEIWPKQPLWFLVVKCSMELGKRLNSQVQTEANTPQVPGWPVETTWSPALHFIPPPTVQTVGEDYTRHWSWCSYYWHHQEGPCWGFYEWHQKGGAGVRTERTGDCPVSRALGDFQKHLWDTSGRSGLLLGLVGRGGWREGRWLEKDSGCSLSSESQV